MTERTPSRPGELRVVVHDTPGAVAREAAAFVAERSGPTPDTVDIAELRRSWWVTAEFGLPGRGSAVDEVIGDVACRVVRPASTHAVYLHLHGGGWVMGSAKAQDRLLEGVARSAGALVVSVDYRLAPEHPFPAALDDCVAVATALLGDPALTTHRFIIGGESSGANLAVATLLRLRDGGLAGRFHGANLAYGAYAADPLPSRLTWDRDLVLSTTSLDTFAAAYAGGGHPHAAPLGADLTGLPPALVTACGLDPLFDDSVLLATRWALAGNEADLDIWPGAPHAIDAFPIALGGLVRRRLGRWVTHQARRID